MIIKIITAILILFFVFENNLLSQESSTNVYILKVKGYKKCTVYSYKYSFGKLDIKSKKLEEIYKYDKIGNQTEMSTYF